MSAAARSTAEERDGAPVRSSSCARSVVKNAGVEMDVDDVDDVDKEDDDDDEEEEEDDDDPTPPPPGLFLFTPARTDCADGNNGDVDESETAAA